ncbi:uncharacterized protein LOC115701061 [Cannabis sativa]|uniref:uncharacterized protein LOC115701061 n=1 Tax=Cannabis sativa TaxID=3483 RepID=UPI0029CA8E20|nr:uncharacterized protein LOC115701061 [Cannabis sativa]XP_060958879.1 uncharacterized protein LOC115701061 [Cannabis sativa]
MDVQGITWVGNVYEKFEAMCLEVEEIMYQDTVKYVENQVQTVGASMKRFYSDVLQDLLPPSSLDSEKISPCGFIIEQDSGERNGRKPNVMKKKEHAKADDEQLTKTSKITPDIGEDVGLAPSFHVRDDVDDSCRPSEDCVKGVYSELGSRRHLDERNTSNMGVSLSQEKLTDVSYTSRPEKYLSGVSCCEFIKEIHEASRDQRGTMTIPFMEDGMKLDSVVESSDKIENEKECISEDCQSSIEIISLNSVGNSGEEMLIQLNSGLSAESNGILFDWNLDASKTETATENGAETVQQSDKMKLEETCVLVYENELSFPPQPEHKWRPYKKKIREALYSRMRSSRKQEYKKLALQYEDDKRLSQESREALTATMNAGTNILPRRDSCESEWELL